MRSQNVRDQKLGSICRQNEREVQLCDCVPVTLFAKGSSALKRAIAKSMQAVKGFVLDIHEEFLAATARGSAELC